MKIFLFAFLSLVVTVYTEPILYITGVQFELTLHMEEPKITGYIEDEDVKSNFEVTIKRRDSNHAAPIGQYWVCNLNLLSAIYFMMDI